MGDAGALPPTKLEFLLDAFVYNGFLSPSEWNELFLLPTRELFIGQVVADTPQDEFFLESSRIRILANACVHYLDDERVARRRNAIQTLAYLIRSLSFLEWKDFTFEFLEALCGFEDADAFFEDLFSALQDMFRSIGYRELKRASVQLLLEILCVHPVMAYNAMIEYFFVTDLSPDMLAIALGDELDQETQVSALSILAIVGFYERKRENNPYLNALRTLSTEEEFQNINRLLYSCFTSFNRRWISSSSNNSGIFPRVWEFVSSIASSLTSPFLGVSELDSTFVDSSNFFHLAVALICELELLQYNDAYGEFLSRSVRWAAAERENHSRSSNISVQPSLSSSLPPALRQNIISELVSSSSYIIQQPQTVYSPSMSCAALSTLRCLTENGEVMKACLHPIGHTVFLARLENIDDNVVTFRELSDSLPLVVLFFEFLCDFFDSPRRHLVDILAAREAIAILHRLLCFVRSRRNFYLPEQLALRLCSSFSRFASFLDSSLLEEEYGRNLLQDYFLVLDYLFLSPDALVQSQRPFHVIVHGLLLGFDFVRPLLRSCLHNLLSKTRRYSTVFTAIDHFHFPMTVDKTWSVSEDDLKESLSFIPDQWVTFRRREQDIYDDETWEAFDEDSISSLLQKLFDRMVSDARHLMRVIPSGRFDEAMVASLRHSETDFCVQENVPFEHPEEGADSS